MNLSTAMCSAITDDSLYLTQPLQNTRREAPFHKFHESDSKLRSHPEQHRPKLEKQHSEPIKFKLERSESELQLQESESAAEYRDYCMYLRIVGGMSSNQVDDNEAPLDPSLVSVMRTRQTYSRRSESAVNRSYDLGSMDDEKASTPVLCNAPLALVDLSFGTTRIKYPMVGSRTRVLPSDELYGYPEASDDERSVDDMFGLDL